MKMLPLLTRTRTLSTDAQDYASVFFIHWLEKELGTTF